MPLLMGWGFLGWCDTPSCQGVAHRFVTHHLLSVFALLSVTHHLLSVVAHDDATQVLDVEFLQCCAVWKLMFAAVQAYLFHRGAGE